jgi:deoxyribodipyrimidine photolyase-related protein
MITNFALLAGVHPDEIDAWYLGIDIDGKRLPIHEE